MKATNNKAGGERKIHGEEDNKESSDDSEYITLKVKSMNNESELCFKIKRSTKLKKLMDTYHMLDSNFPFLFDGRRLGEDQTPDEAGLIDGDEIDVIKPTYGIGTNVIKLDAERTYQFEARERKICGTEEKDKNSADASGQISLKVRRQDGGVVHFTIMRSTKLIKLMRAYCDRFSEDINNHRFLFEGRRIVGEKTPDEVGLKDGDEIEVFLQQFGGAQPL